MRSLCVEGWRGVNHSIAMVNQNQLLQMLQLPGWELRHRDAPYFLPHWQAGGAFDSGFAADEQAALQDIAAPEDGRMFDACLRMASPIRPPRAGEARRTATFMVTEFGLCDRSFEPTGLAPQSWTQGEDFIVTPTRWSADRLVDHGFDASRIRIVPHGYKSDVFTPMAPAARLQARAQLGITPDDILFSQVGVATWNKGGDLLLRAFATLRLRGLPVRLFIKDHKALYGMGVETTLAQLARQHPEMASDRVTSGIAVLSGNLNLQQLRQLYAISDAYVSPYRAEGFNLPVLEAMACGTHVITTGGGATADFIEPALCHAITSRPGTPADAPQPIAGRFLVPELDDLIEAMTRVARQESNRDADARRDALARLAQTHSWSTVTCQLLAQFDA
jgi:glycosyltransferase involved in cell wall biosynthesis